MHASLNSSAEQQFWSMVEGRMFLGEIYIGSRVVDGEDIWRMWSSPALVCIIVIYLLRTLFGLS